MSKKDKEKKAPKKGTYSTPKLEEHGKAQQRIAMSSTVADSTMLP